MHFRNKLFSSGTLTQNISNLDVSNQTNPVKRLLIESAKWRVQARLARVERVARLNEGARGGKSRRGSARVSEGRRGSS